MNDEIGCMAAVRLSLLCANKDTSMDLQSSIKSARDWSDVHITSFINAAATAGWDTSAVICLDKGARLRW
jgi:hypothetical protein